MTPRMPGAALPTLVAVALLVGGCGGAGSSGEPADPGAVRVVTTTTILADLAAQVGGEHVVVASLVPKGGEVHTFDPTPSDVRRLAEADLVLLNGLGLDDWLADLVADAGTAAPVVELAEDLVGVEYLAAGEPDGAADPGHEGEAVNPHLWLDVAYAARYVERIASELSAVDPGHASAYAERAEGYAAELESLDAEAVATLGAIPEANRTVISFHDAFPYFAAAYGLRIDGTIVDAPGQDPSAGEIADLIRVVEASGIRAILAEAQFSDDLARTIAEETGAVVIADLYTDSLGDPPLDTYLAVMRWNVERVAEALAGS